MKYSIAIFFIMLCSLYSRAHTTDHWVILVNGERVFECISTCSSHGLNKNLLKASVKLKPGDKITVLYTKDTLVTKVTKSITVSDSTLRQFQTFSVYDAEGDHAITLKVDDFENLRHVVLWYSEKRMVNSKEVVTEKIALVYFD